MTQAQLAQQLNVGQAAVSKMERRDDVSLNSLRRYIQALGGRLEVIARFADGDFVVTSDLEESPKNQSA